MKLIKINIHQYHLLNKQHSDLPVRWNQVIKRPLDYLSFASGKRIETNPLPNNLPVCYPMPILRDQLPLGSYHNPPLCFNRVPAIFQSTFSSRSLRFLGSILEPAFCCPTSNNVFKFIIVELETVLQN